MKKTKVLNFYLIYLYVLLYYFHSSIIINSKRVDKIYGNSNDNYKLADHEGKTMFQNQFLRETKPLSGKIRPRLKIDSIRFDSF